MPVTCTDKKVVVAISGGVDSSVCASLLLRQGFEVFGAVLDLSPAHKTAVEGAKTVCAEIGIPLAVIDVRREFQKNVVEPFCATYCAGKTPNPCVVCNPTTKFASLISYADSLGINYIASGHYARIDEKDGAFYLKKAVSQQRDQSYMLYSLPQSTLARLLLPLGELSKDEVRAHARELGLSCSDAPDSQEICFIPDGDYVTYMKKAGFESGHGKVIAPDGTIVREHDGVAAFTVGQRRGLGVALGKPVFVKKITEQGDVLLGFAGEEFSSSFTITNVAQNGAFYLIEGKKYSVKVRSAAKPAECSVKLYNGGARVIVDTPIRAPAPGQSAVLYDGDILVGGGVIEECFD